MWRKVTLKNQHHKILILFSHTLPIIIFVGVLKLIPSVYSTELFGKYAACYFKRSIQHRHCDLPARHCEVRSNPCCVLDCFTPFAMTGRKVVATGKAVRHCEVRSNPEAQHGLLQAAPSQ
jgi:hypothetical protein